MAVVDVRVAARPVPAVDCKHNTTPSLYGKDLVIIIIINLGHFGS